MSSYPELAFQFDKELGFQARCPMCREWWPIGLEFWNPHHGMARCRACQNAYRREYQNTRYRHDVGYREDKKEAARLSAWKDRVNRPEEITDRKRAYYHANRARILAGQRARYAANRDELLAKRYARDKKKAA